MPSKKKKESVEFPELIAALSLWDGANRVPWDNNRLENISVVSIDPGLSNPALCYIPPNSNTPETRKIKTIEGSIISRVFYLEHVTRVFVDSNKPSLIVLEGPATQAKFGVELAGKLQYAFSRIAVEYNTPLLIITPQSMRSFMKVGKGDKGSTQLQVFKKYGIELPSFDETDAYALAQCGLAVVRGEYVVKTSKKPTAKDLEWFASLREEGDNGTDIKLSEKAKKAKKSIV